MKPGQVGWSSESKLQIAKLLQDGLTAAKISAQLGVSRNAIIGLVHRDQYLSAIGFANAHGVDRRNKREKAPKKLARKRPVAKLRLVKATPEPLVAVEEQEVTQAEPIVIADPLNLTLEELGWKQCHFIINDEPKGGVHLYCGHPVKEGKSYCTHHYHRVYQTRSKGI